jgi:hypothetical protein
MEVIMNRNKGLWLFGILLFATVLSSCDVPVPLKQAKIIIEHNHTDLDTGFQGFVDSEGWKNLDITGPEGRILSFNSEGKMRDVGLTELFFETVEPPNSEVSIKEMISNLPAGKYTISGESIDGDHTSGTALLTHNIPSGAVLLLPEVDAVVPLDDLFVSWEPVIMTIDGSDVNIISYQLIIEKNEDPDPNMIGKMGLSIHFPSSVTSFTVPKGFLEPGTEYSWEVLAIEESGNQTLSSSSFSTEEE